MNKLSKIAITIIVVVLFFAFFSLIVGSRQNAGHQTPGLLGIIAFAGMIGAIRAIWKKKDSNNDENKH